MFTPVYNNLFEGVQHVFGAKFMLTVSHNHGNPVIQYDYGTQQAIYTSVLSKNWYYTYSECCELCLRFVTFFYILIQDII